MNFIISIIVIVAIIVILRKSKNTSTTSTTYEYKSTQNSKNRNNAEDNEPYEVWKTYEGGISIKTLEFPEDLTKIKNYYNELYSIVFDDFDRAKVKFKEWGGDAYNSQIEDVFLYHMILGLDICKHNCSIIFAKTKNIILSLCIPAVYLQYLIDDERIITELYFKLYAYLDKKYKTTYEEFEQTLDFVAENFSSVFSEDDCANTILEKSSVLFAKNAETGHYVNMPYTIKKILYEVELPKAIKDYSNMLYSVTDCAFSFLSSRSESVNELCTDNNTSDTASFFAMNNNDDENNPSKVFAMFGPTMKDLWDDFVKGENLAAEIFDDYSKYTTQLQKEYANIDFQRVIKYLDGENDTMPITVGDAMYLKLLDIKEDVYISLGNADESVLLSSAEYKNILEVLNDDETAYCEELKDYINRNIRILVNDASRNLYGIDLCNSTIPANTLECVEYHTYIAEENYFNSNKGSKWNRVIRAPIMYSNITKDNPLILISIKHIDVFVLDYLCYATMSVPSDSIDKVLRYKDERTGTTVLQTMIDTYGDGIDDYVERTIVDMNCSTFRSFVRSGIIIK